MMLECQKFCFWQNGEIFGKIFFLFWGRGLWGKEEGKGGGIPFAQNDLGSAQNGVWDAKNFVFGRKG